MNNNNEVKLRARVNKDGSVVLKDLPFNEGDYVEVVLKRRKDLLPRQEGALRLFPESKLGPRKSASSRVVISSTDR